MNIPPPSRLGRGAAPPPGANPICCLLLAHSTWGEGRSCCIQLHQALRARGCWGSAKAPLDLGAFSNLDNSVNHQQVTVRST